MSPGTGVPVEAARLIASHIDSIEQLETLLLLQRTAPRRWTASQVASELRIAVGSALTRLQDLTRRGFCTADQAESFGYLAGSSDAAVRALDQAYRERRVSVITMIFTKPDPVRELADAFRFGKKGGGDG